MQWTVRPQAKTSAGEVRTTEPMAFSRPAMLGTLAEIGLMLDKAKARLAKLQASMPRGQVAEYAAPTGFVRHAECRCPQGPAHASATQHPHSRPRMHGRIDAPAIAT